MNYNQGHKYMRGYWGGEVDLVEWVCPNVAEWVEAVTNIGWYATRHSYAACSYLEVLIHLEWQKLNWDVPGVVAFIGTWRIFPVGDGGVQLWEWRSR